MLTLTFIASAAESRAQSSFLHPLADTASAVSYRVYSPGDCLGAVTRIGLQKRHDAGYTSAEWSQSFLENDTVTADERSLARQCVSQYDIATVAPLELPNLARLYWLAGDTTRMWDAVRRRSSLDTTDSARVDTYLHLLTRFLLSDHRDVAFVERHVVPALDSLNSLNARIVRLEAHTALAYAYASSRAPHASDSTEAEIASAMTSFATMPLIMQRVMADTIGPLFQLGATEATERGDTALARSFLDYARQSLSKIPEGADYVHRTEAVVRYFGMTAPPIHADFVYGAGPHATPDQWPRPGHWTLISPMPYSGNLGSFYRHIHDVVGDTVDIVFYGATRGSWRPRGPLTPSAEGTLLYDYLSRRWRIPGVLLLETRPFHKLPDGRRMDDPTITPELYANTGILIDPQGAIRALLQPSALVRFDRLLQTLIHPSATRGGQ